MDGKAAFNPRRSSSGAAPLGLSPIKRGRGVSINSFDSAEGARDVKKLIIHTARASTLLPKLLPR
jgi:hypothetical protein